MHRFRARILGFVVSFIAVLFASSTGLHAKTKLDWDPEHTWVFAVGLLQWEHSDIYASFPAAMKDRRDEQLVEHFRDAGVPDDQITYLQDSEATKDRIKNEFRELLDETDEGDLLVFYFCGHGSRDPEVAKPGSPITTPAIPTRVAGTSAASSSDRQPLQRQPGADAGRLLPLRRALR